MTTAVWSPENKCETTWFEKKLTLNVHPPFSAAKLRPQRVCFILGGNSATTRCGGLNLMFRENKIFPKHVFLRHIQYIHRATNTIITITKLKYTFDIFFDVFLFN